MHITKSGKVRLYDGLLKKGDRVDGDEIVEEWMIWPLRGKYLYQYPYSVLMNKFMDALINRDSWLFIGFSFRDEGINIIIEDVNDRLNDQRRRGKKASEKNLILVNSSADKKGALFEKYRMIHLTPITGKFGEDKAFDELKEHSSLLVSRN